MQALIDHGYRLADEVFNSNDTRALLPYLQDLANGSDRAQGAATAVIGGAIVRLAGILEAGQGHGISIAPKPPTAGEISYLAATRPAEFWKAADAILAAVQGLFRAAPGIRLGEPTTAAPAAPEPQQITIELRMPAGPLPVRVEAMPDRVRTTAIERNPDGEIVATNQIETDRVAA